MKKILVLFLLIFIVLLFTNELLKTSFHLEFGTENFFDKRGFFFLFFISLFPRLTLLFSSVPFGGFFWWLGFIFYPRVLIASLATVAYFYTNPFLVVISWIFAIGGEILEKKGLRNKKFYFKFKNLNPNFKRSKTQTYQSEKLNSDDVIDVDFKKLD